MHMRNAVVVGMLTSLAGLAAQATIHLPRDPVLFLELDTPAKLRDAFAESNLLRLLDSPEAQELGPTLRDELVAEYPDLAPLLECWNSLPFLDGRLRLGLHLMESEDSFIPSFLFTLELDSAATSSGKALAQFVDGLSGTTQPLVIHGERLRIVSLEDVGLELTVPTLIDEKWVVICGTELSDLLPRFLSTITAGNAADTASPAPIYARLDLARFIEQFLPKGEVDVILRLNGLLDHLGILSLKPITASIMPAKRHVKLVIETEWDRDNPGIRNLFTPKNKGPHGLLDLVPQHSLDWSLGHLDIVKTYSFVLKGLEESALFESLPSILAELDAQIRMSLKDDLLAHLGKEMLILGTGIDPEQDPSTAIANVDPLLADRDLDFVEDLLNPAELVGDICIAISLDNADAFDTSFEKLLRSRGLHAARRRSVHRGNDVQTILLLGLYQISYAITDKVLLLAYGDAGLDNLRAILDMSADVDSGKEAAGFNKLIRDRLSLAGKHRHDLASMSLAALFGGTVATNKNTTMTTLVDLLKKFDLNVIAVALTFEGSKTFDTMIW